jgi:hypothetical protein
MQIQLETQGGFAAIPALNKCLTMNVDELGEHEANELKQLLSEARFFALPKRVNNMRSGAADYRQYKITIADKGKKHTVYLTERLDNPPLRRLLDFLKAKMA